MMGVSYYSYIVAMDSLPAEVHSTFFGRISKTPRGRDGFFARLPAKITPHSSPHSSKEKQAILLPFLEKPDKSSVRRRVNRVTSPTATTNQQYDTSQRRLAADVPGKGTLDRKAGEILDAGATTGAAGDLPGVYGGMASVGWHRGGMETRSVGSGAVDWTLLGATMATHRVSELPREPPPPP